MTTQFAPAERISADEVVRDNRLLSENPTLEAVLSAVSGAVAILSETRQIVYANREFLALIGIETLEPILGMRPGEAFHCIHARREEGGCGTASQCRHCGAVRTILESLSSGRRSEHETRLTLSTESGLVSLDLIVTATPYRQGVETFTLVTLRDNRDTKRKAVMERLFFHDILNSASGVHGALELLHDTPDKNGAADLIDLSLLSSRNLIEEVQTYRLVTIAERGDLVPQKEPADGLQLLNQAALSIRYHEVVRGKKLDIDPASEHLVLLTDSRILNRVLVNMIKNALEATAEGGTARAGLQRTPEGKARYSIWNDAVMTPEVRDQIFQRSFSTKGKDRGLGTWSILLFGEKYLNGVVAFTSKEGQGTEFTLDLDIMKENP